MRVSDYQLGQWIQNLGCCENDPCDCGDAVAVRENLLNLMLDLQDARDNERVTMDCKCFGCRVRSYSDDPASLKEDLASAEVMLEYVQEENARLRDQISHTKAMLTQLRGTLGTLVEAVGE